MKDAERIVIVDADQGARESLRRSLDSEGRVVVAVAGVDEAVSAVKALRGVELAVVDVGISDGRGLELVDRVRGIFPETEFILMSACATSHQAVAAIRLHVFDFFEKPPDNPEKLRRRADEALWRIRLRRQQGALYRDLVEAMERYQLAARGVNDGIWDWDRDESKLFLSARWKSMLGYGDHEIGSCPEEWFKRIHADDVDRVTSELSDHCERRTEQFHSEYRILHKNGSYRWVLARGSAVHDPDGRVSRVVGSQSDITDRKRAEEQILHDAFHDRLTGLANRALFKDRLNRAMALAKRLGEYHWAVVTLGVDGFQLVNESIGPHAGDAVLAEIAQRLQERFLPADTIARLGGDEFAILVEAMDHASDAATALLRIQEAFEQPFVVSDHEVFVTACIGIAMGSPDYARPTEVLRNANIAMYRAKSQGRGQHTIFESGMHADALARLDIDSALRRAIQRKEFRLLYQPIISLESGAILGFEALVRWIHPTRGVMAPMTFIPLAESNGLIVDIGAWVMSEACRQVAAWRRQSPRDVPLVISVNVSERQLSQTTFVEQLEHCLRSHELDSGGLKLEITESAIIGDFDAAAETLASVKRLGVDLAMDDFGTGYSALSYLHRLPFDTLKIDRSFVRGINQNDRNVALLDGTISLAHRLGLSVVAEGIETRAQLDRLRELHCEHGQGFLFAKPLRAEDVTALLDDLPVW